MSTNANIVVKCKDEVIRKVYVHWDGGDCLPVLEEYYNDQNSAEKVISLGYLSVLDKSMDCPKEHNFDNRIKGFSLAYNRDRGDDLKIDEYKNIENYNFENSNTFNIKWCYFWDGTIWKQFQGAKIQ